MLRARYACYAALMVVSLRRFAQRHAARADADDTPCLRYMRATAHADARHGAPYAAPLIVCRQDEAVNEIHAPLQGVILCAAR